MATVEPDAFIESARGLDVSDICWAEVALHHLPDDAARTLRYMQDIETHTLVYARDLLSTRAIDEPDVATFLARWLYEETLHGLALARFLRAAGCEVQCRKRSASTLKKRLDAAGRGLLSRLWHDFVAVYMTWGAINELTTLTGYRRLSKLAGHPVLAKLLGRITRDESRHFQFYFQQARRRLERSKRTRQVVRFLVDHYWAPVGSGVQPEEETRFTATYLLTGSEGLVAARRVDSTIRRLPGFEDTELLESWLRREVRPR